MVKKTKKATKSKVAEKPATITPDVEVPTAEKAVEKKELVMEAKMSYSSSVTVMNKSQSYVSLVADNGKTLDLAPREIKQTSKDLLNELLKNPMVRRFFDKGIVSHNLNEDKVVSASDAKAPEHLSQAVERHEDGSHIEAKVKKFEKEGSLNIDLG